jgi:hypothetical protein
VSRSWARGSTRAWRRTRAQVLARDGYRCQLRIEGVCTGMATCVHHTLGKRYGDDPAHLVAACQPCNARVNDPARTSDHQRVVAWARAHAPTTTRAIARQFPHIDPDNITMIITRAKRRGELVSTRRGVLNPGPTGLPPAPDLEPDPEPRPVTRW